jgi:expansin (peptidoglycan-binding protein)
MKEALLALILGFNALAITLPIPALPHISTVTKISGVASWYKSRCNCNAMTSQIWRGKSVIIKGPKGKMRVKITDSGPEARLHRVADLNPYVFTHVCGSLSKGICKVVITKG